MPPETLSNLALNRALLARQHLLAPTRASVPRVIEHLIGLQAQEPKDPYVALWSRVAGFAPGKLGRRIEARRLVRLTLMRGTIHLVTVRDAYALRPWLQPVLERLLQSRRPHLVGIDLKEVAEAGRRILAKEPLTYAQLGQRLLRAWPESDAEALARVVQVRVPLPQVPPRGIWGKSGVAKHVPLETWTRSDGNAKMDLPTLVWRYLGAWGPASVADMQMWCGLTRLQGAFDQLAPELVKFASPSSKILYDLPRGPRPPPDTVASPRFLPVFDNLTIGLRDRSRVIDPAVRLPVAPMNSFVRFVLIRGFLGATWSVEQGRDAATLTVKAFVQTDAGERAAIREEGLRLLDALYAHAADRTVRLA